MLKTSYKINKVFIGANGLSTIINNETSIEINTKDLKPTDNENVFTLNSEVAVSNDLNNTALYYSDTDASIILGNANTDETETILYCRL